MKTLLIDAGSWTHHNFYAKVGKYTDNDLEPLKLLGIQSILTSLWFMAKEHKPDKIVVAFDETSWRKAYTSDLEACVTHKKYKGNRRKNMTRRQEAIYEVYKEAANIVEEFLRENTPYVIIKELGLEADDLIHQYCKMYSDKENITIASSDEDLLQCQRYPYVKNWSFHHGDFIDLSSRKNAWIEGDVELFLVKKCLAGDQGDNIQGARPYASKKLIRTILEDPLAYTNLMNEEYHKKDSDLKWRVGDLFEENRLLVDLDMAPVEIQELSRSVILEAHENRGKYVYWTVLKWAKGLGINGFAERLKNMGDVFGIGK